MPLPPRHARSLRARQRPIHTSKAPRAALAARDWLTIEWLPKYASERNDIERSWRDLKRHFLSHQPFADLDHLDRAIHKDIADMNRQRSIPPMYRSANRCLVLCTALGTGGPAEIYGTDYPARDGIAIGDDTHVSDMGEAHVRVRSTGSLPARLASRSISGPVAAIGCAK
jgi:hypothetical protein